MSQESSKQQGHPSAGKLLEGHGIQGEPVKLKSVVGERLLFLKCMTTHMTSKYEGHDLPVLMVGAMREDKSLIRFLVNHEVLNEKIEYCFEQAPDGFVGVITHDQKWYDLT